MDGHNTHRGSSGAGERPRQSLWKVGGFEVAMYELVKGTEQDDPLVLKTETTISHNAYPLGRQ